MKLSITPIVGFQHFGQKLSLMGCLLKLTYCLKYLLHIHKIIDIEIAKKPSSEGTENTHTKEMGGGELLFLYIPLHEPFSHEPRHF